MNGSTNTSIQPSSRVIRSEAIIAAEIDESVVMMDVEEGRYYELNPVGARVWALAERGPRIAEVCEALVAEYAVAPGTCHDATLAFVGELSRLGVVRMRHPDDGGEANGGIGHGPPAAGGDLPRDLPPASPDGKPGVTDRTPWTTPSVQVMSIGHTKTGVVATQNHPQETNIYSLVPTGGTSYYS